MFSNLENFLRDDDLMEVEKDTANSSPFFETNDSWLDTSDSFKVKDKTKTNGAGSDDDFISGKGGSSYVPVKGQKTAAKRLKQIQDSLAKELVDTEKIEKGIDKKQKALKTAKNGKTTKKSPSKRSQRYSQRNGGGGGGGGVSRRRGIQYMDSDLDSDSDADTLVERNVGRRAQQHDPNTIVLDCDDEFVGGPAVNFTRNIAGANAVSVEQSQEMKVNVRINNKIEQFQMNPFQKLSSLISLISQKKNMPSNSIVLMFKEKPLNESETLNSVHYIQGLVINLVISNKTKATTSNGNQDTSDKLEIKIQAEGRKRPFTTYLHPTDQLIALAFACAEEFNCDVDKVAIEFDGEFVNFKDTAESLALEGGEVMDFFKKK